MKWHQMKKRWHWFDCLLTLFQQEKREEKERGWNTPFLCILFLPFFFFSCQQYPSFHRSDPLYRELSIPWRKFKHAPPRYLRRVHNYPFKQDGTFSPMEGESFQEYKDRLFNTLEVQQFENEQLGILIEEQVDRIAEIKQQYAIALGIWVKKQLQTANIQSNALSEVKDDSGFSNLFQRYTVIKGDTLQKIARAAYGVYSGWLMIYRFNLDYLVYGPNRIAEGDEILLPEIDVRRDLDLHQLRRKL